jgi:hypothetical protein
MFKKYRRTNTAEMRLYEPGENLDGVSVSATDTPVAGGMIARNPADHTDQWYVAPEYYANNFAEDEVAETPITGYRVLNEGEIAAMNEIKEYGEKLGSIVDKLREAGGDVDQRWVSIGATELQTGLMALTRSIARPTTF